MITSDPRPLIRTRITDITRKSSSLTTTTTTTTRVLTLLRDGRVVVEAGKGLPTELQTPTSQTLPRACPHQKSAQLSSWAGSSLSGGGGGLKVAPTVLSDLSTALGALSLLGVFSSIAGRLGGSRTAKLFSMAPPAWCRLWWCLRAQEVFDQAPQAWHRVFFWNSPRLSSASLTTSSATEMNIS